jgi:hypothetical protein
MKQSAVEYLIENLIFFYSKNWDAIVEQAKEMEKQQIIDSVNKTNQNWVSEKAVFLESGEQYYKETFKNK